MIPGIVAGQMRGPSGGATDPFWSSVVSLLHFDGADDSTTFTDQRGKTWTPASTARLDTAQQKFGTASLLLESTGQYISTPTSSDFAYGTGDFTIEFWMRPTSVSGAQLIYDQKSTTSETQPSILLNTSNLQFVTNNTTRISISGVTINTWHHVALCRSGTSTRLFLNGSAGSVFTDSANYPAPPTAVYVGTAGNAVGNASFDFGGWIDELRVTKGAARYTSNFTPPTAAFPSS